MKLHIGFDDTDSPRAGCTTYIASLIVEKLCKLGVSFIDYPNLIRLNPNVPWKTRGNGALCLRITLKEELYENVREIVLETIEENADFDYEGTDPGAVFLIGDVPNEIESFAKNVIQGVVNKSEALKLIRKFKAEAAAYKRGRGIIGGLAAIGETLKGDYTFEFIAYRRPENWGTPRRIDPTSVIEMDRAMGNLTFNNVDPETGRILITPRGPDPVLYGIRGESPKAVKRAHEMIRSYEPIERWIIFRTNHGTDAHLRRVEAISEIKPYMSVIVRGEVADKPIIIAGGHVIFGLRDGTGVIDCAAYEPTGKLRRIASELIEGDLVEVYGGVRPPSREKPLTINLEKIKLIKLAEKIIYENPLCPRCGKRMKSMGRNKGFECYKCGFHGLNLKKNAFKVERSIKPGLYITPPRSERHLTKPISRYGLEKTGPPLNYGEIISCDSFFKLCVK